MHVQITMQIAKYSLHQASEIDHTNTNSFHDALTCKKLCVCLTSVREGKLLLEVASGQTLTEF